MHRVIGELFSDKSFSVLVTGKSGVGKSSLVNALLGSEIAEVGRAPQSTTKEVTCYVTEIEGVSVTVIDSPGLQDGTGDESKYLEQLKIRCSKTDLNLYCIRMDLTCLDKSERKTIGLLTDLFKEQFWERTVFVLTFANTVLSICQKQQPQQIEEWFKVRTQEWRNLLCGTLQDNKVPRTTTECIPVVPAGHHLNTSIMYASGDPWKLPGVDNWFFDFWAACVRQLDLRAAGIFISMNQRRMADILLPTTICRAALLGGKAMKAFGNRLVKKGSSLGAKVGHVAHILTRHNEPSVRDPVVKMIAGKAAEYVPVTEEIIVDEFIRFCREAGPQVLVGDPQTHTYQLRCVGIQDN